MNPIAAFLEKQKAVILDGGLATELEFHGADLNHPLWSAKLLLEDPEPLRRVYHDYLEAGADIIVSVSYQATFEGFMKLGLSRKEAGDLLRYSVQLPCEVRRVFWKDPGNRKGRLYPLVGGSIGPYGAYLADGSEYSGRYDLSIPEFMDFHRERMAVLADSEADFLDFATIPRLDEAEALIELLREFPHTQAWLSFSCKDEKHISSGEPFGEAVALANRSEQIFAVGLNCTAPRFVEPLLKIAREITGKPLLAYPNSGEKWDAESHCWLPGEGDTNFGELSRRWYEAGAQLIGGCCRTRPSDIRNIRKHLIEE